MVCASYLKPNIKKLNQKAKEAGITMVFEMGLDPGIDHIVTLKMIDDVRKNGG